ncbi:hypothetical protein BS50DRAFT_574207 [Corynespora cassiicola Philippines]|uniref:Uncharacterized protein n=1 Tax=Corynespora cassiicola Philippines TaxID=1448308 RepID=A0A2T2NQ53_CORCC|nr:hypothetical protein BS50DRAFT_574207 [Corynespora cassiicola Philippines]
MGGVQQARGVIPLITTPAKYASALGAYHALLGKAGVALPQVLNRFEPLKSVRRIANAQEASVALDSPTKFAKKVYSMTKYHIDSTAKPLDGERHLYFIYHPDNDWYPQFCEMLDQKQLNRFCGVSDNLPALCFWMRFVRILLRETNRRRSLVVEDVFHIIIPAYWPIHFEGQIDFSDELYPLVIHGEVHQGKPQVKLNLPYAEDWILDNVENTYEEPWEITKAMGLGAKDPTVLGEIPTDADEAAIEEIHLSWRRNRSNGRRRR